jgi:putative lipoprotein
MRGLMLAFTIATGPGEHPRGDRWFGPDKLQHFFTSAFVQSVAYGGLRRAGVESRPAIAGASAVTAFAGVAKEMYDARVKGEFSTRDLVWDAAGAGSASVLLVRTVR